MSTAIDFDPSSAERRMHPHSADQIQPRESSTSATGKSAPGRGTGKGTWLRYTADRMPVAYTCAGLMLHVAVFFWASTAWAAIWVLPLFLVSILVSPINHHHQHFNTFQAPWLNRIYDLFLALQTGIAPYAWTLHHNLGHHRNYLNQRPHDQPDESKWTRRDGSQMGRMEYTVDLLLNHQIDILRIGRRYPKYLRAFLLMKIPLWTILGAALYINATNAFLVIFLPGFMALAHTAWVTYGHHAGFYPTDHYDASFNNINPLFNWITCNLGYHTAHHKRPGVHWSLLPKLHDEIKDMIPKEQIQEPFW